LTEKNITGFQQEYIDDLKQIINTDKYPLTAQDSKKYTEVITELRKQLAKDGCAHVADFIREDVEEQLQRESEELAPQAHYHENQITPYANADDESLPEDHPKRFFQAFTNGFVAKDQISEDKVIQRLYGNPIFQKFIADCLEEEKIYEYADPIAGLVINVMPESTTLPWHFDTNEFIVSLMTKRPDKGGDFEYAPGIREVGNENFDEVKRVLQGDRDLVKTLTLNTGDLQIFKGRFSMHRVAPAQGQRLCAIFGYSKEPGMIGRVQRTKDVYGRVTQAHIDAEKNQQQRSDGLVD